MLRGEHGASGDEPAPRFGGAYPVAGLIGKFCDLLRPCRRTHGATADAHPAVTLTGAVDDLITAQIAAGRLLNASEAVHAGLGLLQQQTAEDNERLAALQRLVPRGIDQLDKGDGLGFATGADLARHVAALAGGKPAIAEAPRLMPEVTTGSLPAAEDDIRSSVARSSAAFGFAAGNATVFGQGPRATEC